ncbi:MAG TPA: putative sulfate exporter family transporter [Xanthobacteraceae bacterium]|nr:putative sulfate exporter family transporter [Xanthobacteraceae bacterium]
MIAALGYVRHRAPGVALCAIIALAAYGLEAVEARLAGYPYIAALVIAILLGIAIRAIRTPSESYRPGITFSGKFLLELAIVLLGASLSPHGLAGLGGALIATIAGVVAVALTVSFAIGRACGLSWRMALLVACGNSICGNSAIAAVAPVIGADSRDITVSIAFTAILGVVLVLTLPLLVPLLGLSFTQYGVVAGLTVYAVPQVLAATIPISTASVQIGTLVKLVRVLMMGPMVLLISLGMNIAGRRGAAGESGGAPQPAPRRTFWHFVPWFIVGFVVLAGLRAIGVIPAGAISGLSTAANILAVVAMAALGLDVDLGAVRRASGPVTLTVTLSLIALLALSLGTVFLLGIL